MKCTTAGAAAVLAALALIPAAWAELRLDSGVERTVMIELYTSEGCSSCPPAEAYLNGFVQDPGLWQTYIPLAFHVDYWDYLGWQDRFADRRHSLRQQRYASLRRVRTVYTPAFIVNGRAWRPEFPDQRPAAATASPGRLSVIIDGDQVVGQFVPAAEAAGPLTLHLAVLGMGLSTKILAGENEGRHARHEFVVLGYRNQAGDSWVWRATMPEVSETTARRALVAWVTRDGDPTPVQAVGGYLPAADRPM